jgi:cytochrome c oxidase subunit 1
MYFVIAYDIWPHLTGRAFDSFGLMRAQLWTWFVGMIVLTFPWHSVGILGMPRRTAFYDYTDPAIAAQAASVTMSIIGGAILVVSGALFLVVLARGRRRRGPSPRPTASASPCIRRARCRPRSMALGSGSA